MGIIKLSEEEINEAAMPECGWHKDCFANDCGKCAIIVGDTAFPGRADCPFYKTDEEYEEATKNELSF